MFEKKMKPRDIVGIVVIVLVGAFLALVNSVRLENPPREIKATAAKSTLRSLSTAAENFKTSGGAYPQAMADLLTGNPPYVGTDYCKKGTKGYRYKCHFSADGYTIVATPMGKPDRINKVFTITTGGILSPEK